LIGVTIPHRAVYLAIVLNIGVAQRGAAFELFILGMTGSAPGSTRTSSPRGPFDRPVIPSVRAGSAFARAQRSVR
jgi:hypothetical protein